MKTYATITGPDGPIKLTFCQSVVDSYCKLINCDPTIESVLANYEGGRQIEALCEIVRAGYQQSLQEAGLNVSVYDYQACELIETGTLEEGMNVTKAFFSVVLGQDYDLWEQKKLATEKDNNQVDKANFLGVFSYN